MNDKGSAHPIAQTQAAPPVRVTSKATIQVQNSETKPYDQTVKPELLEFTLNETFSGDWEGESLVRALQVMRENKSAAMVSMQRFRGTLGGRRGTFVLQGAETIENKKISAKWSVVPGSGTDELMGLRGEGGFEGEFGKGSVGTLSYWFEP